MDSLLIVFFKYTFPFAFVAFMVWQLKRTYRAFFPPRDVEACLNGFALAPSDGEKLRETYALVFTDVEELIARMRMVNPDMPPEGIENVRRYCCKTLLACRPGQQPYFVVTDHDMPGSI